MAGTVPGFANAQVNDLNGKPMIGALLYMYAAGTTTPQDMFSDPGLSVVLRNPLSTDAYGRIPMFYVADGSCHPRLTDANGSVLADIGVCLVVGPSGGSIPGPGVDANSVASTGDIKFRPTSETLSGWVKLNGLTIGSVSSGASLRANADTQSLFIYLWNNFDDAHCPVVTGRGASAAADWAANKKITVPDWRGRGPHGLDDMGGGAAGRLTGATFAGGDAATTPGGYGGEAAHTLASGEIPAHTHTGTTAAGTPHHHNATRNHSAWGGGALDGPITNIQGTGLSNTFSTQDESDHTHTFTTDNAGGGGSHNNMQPFVLGTWHMKL
jgi:microcystin-dependent protein